jgi:hypothetical protein
VPYNNNNKEANMLDLPELRSELLETAQEYLDDQYKITRKFGEVAFEAAVKSGAKTLADHKEFMPPMYTMTDVMKLAKELETFVVSGVVPATK